MHGLFTAYKIIYSLLNSITIITSNEFTPSFTIINGYDVNMATLGPWEKGYLLCTVRYPALCTFPILFAASTL